MEDQHRIATRRLVDSDEEHALLEALIDASKPALPETAQRGLHYLLSTPFRYPPLRYGSRFGKRSEHGIWYGSEQIRTAFSEVAYYRLLFLEGTEAARDLSPLFLIFTVFDVELKSEHAVDLTGTPFRSHQGVISSKTEYEASQRLGRDMRDAGIEVFRYVSARDKEGGINVALFSPRAFASKKPKHRQSWLGVANPDVVEFSRKDGERGGPFRMPRADYEVEGCLPAPAF